MTETEAVVEKTALKEEHANAHDMKLTPLIIIQQVASLALCAFCVTIVGALIFTGNTRVADETNPWIALIVCALAVTWLSMIEGCQASLVGLPPVDPVLYKDSHPITYKIAGMVFSGDNFDRFLMGRQFMVLLVVFVINQCGAPLDPKVDVLGLPEGVKFVFLDIGLAMLIFTAILGQLHTEINASYCMIAFVNNYFAYFTVFTALCIEKMGILHSAYLIKDFLGAVTGKPIITNEPPKKGAVFLFYWGRVIMSLAILGFCCAIILASLFQGKSMITVKHPNISNGLSVVLLLIFMTIIGILEGTQIAYFSVAKLTKADREKGYLATKTSEILFDGTGVNLPGFMVGRQLTVCGNFFLVGSICSLNIIPGTGNNIFGVSDGAQEFLNFGFQGAVTTTILASLIWRYTASAFPFPFINNPISFGLMLFAIGLNNSGLCHGAWVIARVVKKITGLQYDEVYVGTPEERAANNHPDKDLTPEQDVGHLHGTHFMGHLCGSHDPLDGPTKSKDPIDAAA
ncbi:hypothetical protein ACHAWU_005723 [Discostella pseudostelligera]|jgi:hypothetical protein|uniref:Silicon transporter n=1 Tax=Discostella pseudostelligera TaxID=259834 RepID=A0ABD3MTZ3_9STRA